MACNLTAVTVTLVEITDQNREAVLALRVAPGQERFAELGEDSLAAAASTTRRRGRGTGRVPPSGEPGTARSGS